MATSDGSNGTMRMRGRNEDRKELTRGGKRNACAQRDSARLIRHARQPAPANIDHVHLHAS
jgi:hypothetical protein